MKEKETVAQFLARYITGKGFCNGEYYTNEEWIADLTPTIEEGMKEWEKDEKKSNKH